MDFKGYFEKELVGLHRLADQAAAKNPALRAALSAPGGRDPDAERLMESFAFLGGRLRQKLDDALPEITHGLFSRLWPNYLRPLPAASIVQYHPTDNTTGSTLIPKGSFVESIPIDGTPCTFQTVYDTEVLPIQITEQQFIESNGATTLAVRFSLTSGTLATLPLTSLRFFFTGKQATAYSLYYTMIQGVKEVRFIVRDAQKKEHCTAVLAPSTIRAVGFEEQEGLYPYPETTALGYRILQEYFCFPEKFLFAEITGLESGVSSRKLQNLEHTNEFELHFVLLELPKEHASFHKDNWKLFCTPVVNLFPLQSIPLDIADPRRAFKVTPNPEHPEHFSVYSINHVSSWTESRKNKVAYENGTSFDTPFSGSFVPTYQQHVYPALNNDDVETFITLNSDSAKPITVGLALACTNRMLPKQLGIGDICVPAEDNDASALPFNNILPVVSPFPPPLHGELLWQLLSTMSLNYSLLTDTSSLKAALSTYNFRALHDHECARLMKQTLQGITSMQSVATDRIFKGLPVRGTQTRIALDQDCFSCKGALYLFGAVLNEFLALYATENSFQQTIITTKNKECPWPARFGSISKSH